MTPVSLQLFDLSQSHQHLPVKNNMRLQPKPVFNSPSDRTFAFHRALVIKKKSLIQKLTFLPTVEVRSQGLRSLSTGNERGDSAVCSQQRRAFWVRLFTFQPSRCINTEGAAGEACRRGLRLPTGPPPMTSPLNLSGAARF